MVFIRWRRPCGTQQTSSESYTCPSLFPPLKDPQQPAGFVPLAAKQQTNHRDGQCWWYPGTFSDALCWWGWVFGSWEFAWEAKMGESDYVCISFSFSMFYQNMNRDSIHLPIVVPDSASITRAPTALSTLSLHQLLQQFSLNGFMPLSAHYRHIAARRPLSPSTTNIKDLTSPVLLPY